MSIPIIDTSVLKYEVLSPYPTTIRRSVCLAHIISVDHSVNRWLYRRWQESCSVESELNSLHRDMAAKISGHVGDPNVKVEFIHLAPKFDKNIGNL